MPVGEGLRVGWDRGSEDPQKNKQRPRAEHHSRSDKLDEGTHQLRRQFVFLSCNIGTLCVWVEPKSAPAGKREAGAERHSRSDELDERTHQLRR